MICAFLGFVGLTLVAWSPNVAPTEGGLTFSWDAIFKGLWIIASLGLTLLLLPMWKQVQKNTKSIDKIALLTDETYLKKTIILAVHEGFAPLEHRVSKLEGRLEARGK